MAYDHEIATMTVYMEASSEGPEGMLAVAYVIINRLKSGRWGKTLAAVCFAPHQFSSWFYVGPNMERLANLEELDPVLGEAENAVMQALGQTVGGPPDPTNGALYYFRYDIVKPPWAANLKFLKRIGAHEFYR
jgi:spore germination cell wall hydrolase CwlJ-like protein